MLHQSAEMVTKRPQGEICILMHCSHFVHHEPFCITFHLPNTYFQQSFIYWRMAFPSEWEHKKKYRRWKTASCNCRLYPRNLSSWVYDDSWRKQLQHIYWRMMSPSQYGAFVQSRLRSQDETVSVETAPSQTQNFILYFTLARFLKRSNY